MRIERLPNLKQNEINIQNNETLEGNFSFLEEIKGKIAEVDNFQHEANKAMADGAIKGAENIHEAMIKLQEAEISLRFLLRVRNKVLEAYREIMRMQF